MADVDDISQATRGTREEVENAFSPIEQVKLMQRELGLPETLDAAEQQQLAGGPQPLAKEKPFEIGDIAVAGEAEEVGAVTPPTAQPKKELTERPKSSRIIVLRFPLSGSIIAASSIDAPKTSRAILDLVLTFFKPPAARITALPF